MKIKSFLRTITNIIVIIALATVIVVNPALANSNYNSEEPDIPVDIVWIEDTLPDGALPVGTWNWISTNPSPFSDSLAHQSILASGLHQHFFTGATETLQVNPDDTLIAYVYLDPTNTPSEIMLQWNG